MFGFADNNITSDVVAEADSATMNIDTTSICHSWTCTQNFTLNFSNTGFLVVLVITCDATPRTLTYGTGVHGAAGTLVLTASKKNVLFFIYDGTEHVLASSLSLS